jgi:hypothetical protein
MPGVSVVVATLDAIGRASPTVATVSMSASGLRQTTTGPWSATTMSCRIRGGLAAAPSRLLVKAQFKTENL